MIKDREDEENDHEDQWTRRTRYAEKADHAHFGKVDTCEELLEGAWVYETFSVDVGVGHKKDVVTEGEVEEGHADCSETEDERSDTGVCKAWTFRLVNRYLYMEEKDVPMTAMLVKTGRVDPHEIALRLAHFIYIFLGVPERYL